ncbi:MAG: hypothetical protein E7055_11195 [Lentisphaerae bacterium]|nr:hypothetical protein [Lentisphaerota bacterium]
MRRFTTLSLLAAAVLCGPVFAQEPDNPNGEQKQEEKPKYVPKDKIVSQEHKVSNERIDKIQALLQKYYDEHKDLENSSVIGDLRRDIQAFVPVTPEKKADSRSLIAIKDSLKDQVDKKYPDRDKLKKTAEAEAVKQFPLAERNQEIKVHYKRGRTIYSEKGRYYGLGYGGKSIRLNSRSISLFDLLPESKSMFDKKINAEMRKKYVDGKLAVYDRQRLNYSEKLFAAEFAKIRKANEKLGYIYQHGQWVTAEMILKQKLPEKIRLSKERAEKERLEREAREKAKREAGGNNPEGEQKNDDEEDE